MIFRRGLFINSEREGLARLCFGSFFLDLVFDERFLSRFLCFSFSGFLLATAAAFFASDIFIGSGVFFGGTKLLDVGWGTLALVNGAEVEVVSDFESLRFPRGLGMSAAESNVIFGSSKSDALGPGEPTTLGKLSLMVLLAFFVDKLMLLLSLIASRQLEQFSVIESVRSDWRYGESGCVAECVLSINVGLIPLELESCISADGHLSSLMYDLVFLRFGGLNSCPRLPSTVGIPPNTGVSFVASADVSDLMY